MHNRTLQSELLHVPRSIYSDYVVNSYYTDMSEMLGKLNHYTIVMKDFNALAGQ